MNQSPRAPSPSPRAPRSLDEESGVRPLSQELSNARRAWAEEDRQEEEAAAALFEWELFVKEFHAENASSKRTASVRAEDPVAVSFAEDPAALSFAEEPLPLVRRRHVEASDEATDFDFADESVPMESWARRVWIRRAGVVLVVGLYAAVVEIASTRAGADALASWLTMDHASEVRQEVRQALRRW